MATSPQYQPERTEPSSTPLPSRDADVRPEDRSAMDALLDALKGSKK